MKKSYYVLLALLFSACANENKTENNTVARMAASGKENTSAANSTGCAAMILFHKGAVVESTSFDATGKESGKQTTTVTDVSEEGGVTTAVSTAQYSSAASKPFNLIYKCDGKNLYMDLNSIMQHFSVLKDAKTDVKSLSFPLNIKVGETLPESSMSVAMDRGNMKMTIKTTYKNRLVGAKEKITTPAGSWDCYKINADIVSEMEAPDEKTKQIMEAVTKNMQMKMVMWYAPEFGFVKMETLRNDKLFSYTETTKVSLH